jgi:hypothetical protein
MPFSKLLKHINSKSVLSEVDLTSHPRSTRQHLRIILTCECERFLYALLRRLLTPPHFFSSRSTRQNRTVIFTKQYKFVFLGLDNKWTVISMALYYNKSIKLLHAVEIVLYCLAAFIQQTHAPCQKSRRINECLWLSNKSFTESNPKNILYKLWNATQ